jgi:Predicted transcriptional regulators
MTLGQKIKAARLEQGLTQKEVVGSYITRNMLSKIENDNATPSVKSLTYLANILGVPVSEFLNNTTLSDGFIPDGLDEARMLFRAKDYLSCLESLERNPTAAASDEGCLLYAYACAAAMRNACSKGDMETAREFAKSGIHYNQQSMYRAPHLDLELNLVLSEKMKTDRSLEILEVIFRASEDYKSAYHYATLSRRKEKGTEDKTG